MPRPTFTRRTFLTASSLALFAPETLADILKGPNPTRHGQRDRDTWLGAANLEGVRLGPKKGRYAGRLLHRSELPRVRAIVAVV